MMDLSLLMEQIHSEETALIDLLIDIQEPIVITGAMRSSNEIGSDGLYNFISAKGCFFI